MDNDMRRSISAYILPLLPSAILTGPHEGSRGQRSLVSFDTTHKIRLYPPCDDDRYYLLKRSVPFSLEEKEVVAAIAGRMTECFLKHGEEEVLRIAPEVIDGVIAEAVAPECPGLLKKIIGLYLGWLEKNPPPYHCGHNMGISLKRRAAEGNDFMKPENLESVGKLGSTPDTLIVLDSGGGICGIDNFAGKNSSAARQDILAPLAVSGLAAWTGAGQKIALRLTPQGDILLFRKRSLLFARRPSGWRCLPHSLVMDDFVPENMDKQERESRRAVQHKLNRIRPGM